MSVFVWSGAPAEMKVTSHVENSPRAVARSKAATVCGAARAMIRIPVRPRTRRRATSGTSASDAMPAPHHARLPHNCARVSDNRCVDCHMPKKSGDRCRTCGIYRPLDSATCGHAGQGARFLEAGAEAFRNSKASDRDLGLAYAFIVEGERNPVYEARAFELLRTRSRSSPTIFQRLCNSRICMAIAARRTRQSCSTKGPCARTQPR